MKPHTPKHWRALLAVASVAFSSLVLASGCAETTAPTSTAPGMASDVRVVQHANGRYELRGQGTAAAPYYWVWIPGGATLAAPPAVPGVPATVVTAPAERVRTYPEGRYELVGDGSAQAPYYWVWIPTGVTAPAPPPLPRRQVP